MARIQKSDYFPTTQTTLFEQLGDNDASVQEAAMSRLALLYEDPIRTYVRLHRFEESDVEDLVQGYYERIVLKRRLFEEFDRDKGRLRALIRTSLRRYLINHIRDVKRPRMSRADQPLDSLAAEGGVDADLQFDRMWYVSVFRQALRESQSYYHRRDLDRYWRAFEQCALKPVTLESQRPAYGQVAEKLGFASAQHVAVAVQRVKSRLMRSVRDLLAESTRSRDDLEAEYTAFVQSLRGAMPAPTPDLMDAELEADNGTPDSFE